MTVINGLTDGQRRQAVASALLKAGFDEGRATKFTAISWAEAGCVEDARSRYNTDGTTDRGAFQLNDHHQTATDECADDYECSARYVYNMWKDLGKRVYGRWHAYNSGKWMLFLPQATRAVRRAARELRG